MKKKIKDLTLKEFRQYAHLRTFDGNWSFGIAATCATFLSSLPKRKFFESKKNYNLKCEKIYKENLHLLWNFDDYPNMEVDIKTGKIDLCLEKEVEK